MRLVAVFAAVVLFLPAGQVSAEVIHKWTDEQGRVHFGDRPPANVKTEIQRVDSADDNSFDSGAAAEEVENALKEVSEPPATEPEDGGPKLNDKMAEKVEANKRAARERREQEEKEAARQEQLREQTGTYGSSPPAQSDSTGYF